MNEVANIRETALTPIAMLAEEARVYSENMAMNMLNLGRVFVEAKKQLQHGEWGEWVQENAGMSMRTAQQLMQVYVRFGNNPRFAGLEKAKMYKMLSLPEGAEDAFAEENDLANMSSREVDEAVKRVRAETDALLKAQKETLDQERKARRAAEARAEALAERPQEIPEEVTASLREKDDAIERQRQEITRLADMSRNTIEQMRGLQRELVENNAALEDMQQDNDRLQQEILNYQSAAAKGDAERTISEELTSEAFASAVRQFIGVCARMPHMGRTFAAMPNDEHRMYDELLQTVESWARESRCALNTYSAEGVEIHG